MEMVAIVIVFLGFIAFREWTTYKHVKDLETKLIAKNASEYLTYKRGDEPQQDTLQKEQVQTNEFIDISGMNFEDFTRAKRGE